MWNVLVVDDKEVQIRVIKHFVESYKEGLIVKSASTEADAIEIAQELGERLDVAVVDLQLTSAKKFEGLRVAARIRELSPNCFTILGSEWCDTFDFDEGIVNAFVSYQKSPHEYRTQLEKYLAQFFKRQQLAASGAH